MRRVSIKRHIDFLFHFFVFVSGFAAEGDASPALEHLRAVGLLFQETDEHGTVQVAAVKVAGHAGIETTVVRLGLADNLHGAGLGCSGNGTCRKETEEQVAQL